MLNKITLQLLINLLTWNLIPLFGRGEYTDHAHGEGDEPCRNYTYRQKEIRFLCFTLLFSRVIKVEYGVHKDLNDLQEELFRRAKENGVEIAPNGFKPFAEA